MSRSRMNDDPPKLRFSREEMLIERMELTKGIKAVKEVSEKMSVGFPDTALELKTALVHLYSADQYLDRLYAENADTNMEVMK